MANAVYPKALKKFLDGELQMLAQDIKVMLIDTDDDGYDAADEFLGDILTAARVAASANLAGKSSTAGVFKANPASWASVTGDPCEAVVVYRDTGNVSTSPLIVWFDSFDSGFPFTPNGGGFTLNWHEDGIFSI
jgi:hypothetical protein